MTGTQGNSSGGQWHLMDHLLDMPRLANFLDFCSNLLFVIVSLLKITFDQT